MSENITVLSPVVERYALTLSIPMEMPIVMVKGQSIYEAEDSFVRKINRVNDHGRKVELDRARAVLKYASTYGADLSDMYNEDHKLKITLSFATVEDLIDFRDTMCSAVSAATMK